MKVLITGPSGAGKTYLTEAFQKMGLHAQDSDQIHGLDAWYDSAGNKVTMPEGAGKDFLDNHRFLWDREFLARYLNQNPNVCVLGMSGNVFDMVDLFDKVYFLHVPTETLEQRVQHGSRENPMGRTDEQREAIVSWAKHLEEKARGLRIEFIDGTLSAEQIFARIAQS